MKKIVLCSLLGLFSLAVASPDDDIGSCLRAIDAMARSVQSNNCLTFEDVYVLNTSFSSWEWAYREAFDDRRKLFSAMLVLNQYLNPRNAVRFAAMRELGRVSGWL